MSKTVNILKIFLLIYLIQNKNIIFFITKKTNKLLRWRSLAPLDLTRQARDYFVKPKCQAAEL